MNPEFRNYDRSFEMRAGDAIDTAKKDAVKNFLHFLLGSFDKVPLIEPLEQAFGFIGKITDIERAIESSQKLAQLESEVLRTRLVYVTSRRKVLFQKAYDISIEPLHERLKRWGLLSPILSDITPELQLLPADAKECEKFILFLHNPQDRYTIIRNLAGQKLKQTRNIPLLDEQLEGQRRRLENIHEGLLGPSQITLFDVIHAAERIRQRRMDIEGYHKIS